MTGARLFHLIALAWVLVSGVGVAEEPVDPDVLKKVRRLVNNTLSTDAKEREEAWNGLKSMGNLAVPGLIGVYRQKETSVDMTLNILLALGDSHDPRAGPALVEILGSKDISVRKAAARALGDSGYKEGLPALQKIFDDEKESENVRLFAASAGGKLGGAEALAALKKLMASTAPEIRSRAVFALGKYGGATHIKDILTALKDIDASVREDAIEALRLAKSPDSYGALVEATSDTDFKVRSAAMDVLRELTGKKLDNNPSAWRDWWKDQQK